MNEHNDQPANRVVIEKKRDSKNLVIGLLIAGLILLA